MHLRIIKRQIATIQAKNSINLMVMPKYILVLISPTVIEKFLSSPSIPELIRVSNYITTDYVTDLSDLIYKNVIFFQLVCPDANGAIKIVT